MSPLDEPAVEKAAAGLRLKLPRAAQRGKVGEVRANSIGSSMELHDFRHYQPGDDLRHIDWNAVARTGEVVLRVRREEVSPRLEVVLDASRSMGVSDAKAARAREIALWLALLGARGGLDVALVAAGATGTRAVGAHARTLLRTLEADGRDSFDSALLRAPPLRPCGLRVVVSDFLFEAPAIALSQRLAREATRLCLLQVLDSEDTDPTGGSGARLVDAESGEFLERVLVPSVIAGYRERLAAHQKLWRDAARRVAADFVTVSAQESLLDQARGALSILAEVG